MVRGRRHRPVAGLGGGGRNHPQSVVRAGRASAAVILSGPLLIWKLAGPSPQQSGTIVDPLARLSGSEANKTRMPVVALRGIVEQAAADVPQR